MTQIPNLYMSLLGPRSITSRLRPNPIYLFLQEKGTVLPTSSSGLNTCLSALQILYYLHFVRILAAFYPPHPMLSLGGLGLKNNKTATGSRKSSGNEGRAMTQGCYNWVGVKELGDKQRSFSSSSSSHGEAPYQQPCDKFEELCDPLTVWPKEFTSHPQLPEARSVTTS